MRIYKVNQIVIRYNVRVYKLVSNECASGSQILLYCKVSGVEVLTIVLPYLRTIHLLENVYVKKKIIFVAHKLLVYTFL